MFRTFGLPEEIVSDRGVQFTSKVWSSFFTLLNVQINLFSGYHPQSNGQTERPNQEIGRFLRTYCSKQQGEWSRFLPWAEYAQNSLRSSSTNLTPFQCILGFQPALSHGLRNLRKSWQWTTGIDGVRRSGMLLTFGYNRPSEARLPDQSSLALHAEHPSPPPFQEAKPSFHWPIQDCQASQCGVVSVTVALSLQDQSNFPCLLDRKSVV